MKLSPQQLEMITDKDLRDLRRSIHKEIKRRKRLDAKQPTDSVTRSYSLYVIVCSGSKFYVGITSQKVEARFNQHVNGKGAMWTRQHKPIGIEESYCIGKMTEAEATRYEREKTHEIIAKYGAENVRGGDLCYINQDLMDKRIEKSFRSLQKAQSLSRRSDKKKSYQAKLEQEQIVKELAWII